MKKLNTLDKVLITLASFLFAFVVATIIIYTYKNWQFDTLIQGVVGVGGVESLAMAGIQISKYFRDKKGKENESEVNENGLEDEIDEP